MVLDEEEGRADLYLPLLDFLRTLIGERGVGPPLDCLSRVRAVSVRETWGWL